MTNSGSDNGLKRIAIFASGSGTNAQRIMEHFRENPSIKVELILSNKPDAYVLERAKQFEVPTVVFDRPTFRETNKIVEQLQGHHIDLIVLAGFLWLVPANLIRAFPNKIINIHPALLPKYGGKGMYGHHVHEAVIEAKEQESGITVHYVNEQYDEGAIIFQATCPITPSDTPDSLAQKIHVLEHEHYPKVIEGLLCEK